MIYTKCREMFKCLTCIVVESACARSYLFSEILSQIVNRVRKMRHVKKEVASLCISFPFAGLPQELMHGSIVVKIIAYGEPNVQNHVSDITTSRIVEQQQLRDHHPPPTPPPEKNP